MGSIFFFFFPTLLASDQQLFTGIYHLEEHAVTGYIFSEPRSHSYQPTEI